MALQTVGAVAIPASRFDSGRKHGGLSRPSTGYTFGAIQRHTQQMLEGFRRIQPADIQSNQAKLRAQLLYRIPARFQVYDRTLLRVLVDQRYPGGTLFERLFARNSTLIS